MGSSSQPVRLESLTLEFLHFGFADRVVFLGLQLRKRDEKSVCYFCY
jgi:hypothetical protein